jgi:hypothetical protein
MSLVKPCKNAQKSQTFFFGVAAPKTVTATNPVLTGNHPDPAIIRESFLGIPVYYMVHTIGNSGDIVSFFFFFLQITFINIHFSHLNLLENVSIIGFENMEIT